MFIMSEVPLYSVQGSGAAPPALLSPLDPSFRALSGRLKLTVRRHKFNKDSVSSGVRGQNQKRET